MPPLPEIADCFRVTFNWTNLSGGPSSHNVMHFTSASLNEEDLGNALEAQLDDAMFTAISADYECVSLDIIKLDGTSATQTYEFTGGGFHGDGSDQIIYEGAACVSLRSLVRGPKGRGRVFLGPVSEGSTGNGLINPTGVAIMQSAWDSFIIGIAGADAILSVASYVHETAYAVQTAHVDEYLCTQRRRLVARRA